MERLPDFEANWVSFDAIHQQFPHFHLEDKVKLLRGVLLVDLLLIKCIITNSEIFSKRMLNHNTSFVHYTLPISLLYIPDQPSYYNTLLSTHGSFQFSPLLSLIDVSLTDIPAILTFKLLHILLW